MYYVIKLCMDMRVCLFSCKIKQKHVDTTYANEAGGVLIALFSCVREVIINTQLAATRHTLLNNAQKIPVVFVTYDTA